MADEFEWVSDGSSKEEEKNTLPVVVKEKSQTGQRAVYVIGKIFLVIGTLILALFARILWLLARLKIPPVVIPNVVKVFFARLVLWISSIRINRPSWLKIPDFVYRIKIPDQVSGAIISGLCFVLILSGAGALFAIYSKADYLSNYILLIAGLVAAIWLIWKRSAAAIVASWLLQIMRNRKADR
ncbi:MAG: hypothetical protein ACRBBN_16495 [Methyloligellaceae bacterium]